MILGRGRDPKPSKFVSSCFNYSSIRGDYFSFLSRLNFFRQHSAVEKFLKKNDFNLIYSRGIRGGLVGSYIKTNIYDKKITLLNDVRGDVLDEHKNSFIRKKMLNQSNKIVCENSNFLFLVSKFLKEKTCELYKFNKKNAYVFPTFVPDEKFSFSEQNRSKMRRKLGFSESDIVVLYSGNLAEWQNIDTILSAFSKTSNKDLKLLILTKDSNISKKIIIHDIENTRVTVRSVDYEEIQNYYHAGDYGILIRDNTDTNKCAAPTKFSEYVNSGLAVIINEIEADYVELFKRKNLAGILIQNKSDLKVCFDNLRSSQRNTTCLNTLSGIVEGQMQIFSK